MKKKGFGLVEILIASSLLLFAIGGTAQLLMVSLSSRKSADFCLAATRCASTRLEYFKSLPYDSPELQPGTSGSLVTDGALLRDLATQCTVEDLEPAMKRITLKISDVNSPGKSQTFCLLLCRELEF
jgi:Tfp pilus assembly protein PilV